MSTGFAEGASCSGRVLLEETRQQPRKVGIEAISLRQRHGSLVESLRDLNNETRLIVMGRAGHGHDSHAIGSNIESVARIIPHPLLLTVGPFTPPRHVLIAYDGRETADKALARIASSPLLRGVECHLVMVSGDGGF